MSSFLRALVLSVGCVFAPVAASADDAEATLGGFICARPIAPSCVGRTETYQSNPRVEACKGEIDQFAAATAIYRDCLERQIALAVRSANDVIDRFRCSSGRGPCPAAAKRP
jgi:hypothetical protein